MTIKKHFQLILEAAIAACAFIGVFILSARNLFENELKITNVIYPLFGIILALFYALRWAQEHKHK